MKSEEIKKEVLEEASEAGLNDEQLNDVSAGAGYKPRYITDEYKKDENKD